MSADLTEKAMVLAETVLFPTAVEVDRSGVIPAEHWQLLARAGLYGIAVPADRGGPGLTVPALAEITEIIAGGCLATAFTWIQHHGMVSALAASANTALRDHYLPALASGALRGGVAYAGAVPVPPRMTAERGNGGWVVSGHAPFVSGWGIIDVLTVSAGDPASGDIIAALIPAENQPGITTLTPLELMVANATNTVAIEVQGLFVPDDRVVGRVSRAGFLANQTRGSRLNATLTFGIIRRCVQLLGESGQREAADALGSAADGIRQRCDSGLSDAQVLLAARADAAELAVRAAATAVAAAGGPGLLGSAPAQLLARQAIFTLVAASRPELKALLIDRLSGRYPDRGL